MTSAHLEQAPGPARGTASWLTNQTTLRIWALSAALAGLAAALGVWLLPATPPIDPPFELPWWALAAGFYLAEAWVIHLHIGRSAHSFSMSELPMVAGLFLVPPGHLIAARLVGSAAALIVNRHQRSMKLAFNLALFALGTVCATVAFSLGRTADGVIGPSLWLATFAATMTDNAVGVLAISAAIALSDGTSQLRRVPDMLRIGAIVTATNTSLALMGLTVLLESPQAAWMFVVPIATVTLAYRAYVTERQRHESIELLYESTRILQRNPQLDGAIVDLLRHARRMFRADVAEICLLPPRDGGEVLVTQVGPGEGLVVMRAMGAELTDPLLVRAVAQRRAFLDLPTPGGHDRDGSHPGGALVAPLLGESSLIGTFRLAHRLSELSDFDPSDLKLFETLANHAAVALENGQLEQSLEQLSELKDELDHQASHDALTGLANRTLFLQSLTQRLSGPGAQGEHPVVLFIDVDDFKLVNDSLGHAAGDSLLIGVGERIRGVLRPEDVAARLGGDEFAVLLWDQPDVQNAQRVATRLMAALTPPFRLDGREVTIRASIGVSVGHPGRDSAGDLVREADVAMYSAKARGKGQVVLFEPSMQDAVTSRARLTTDLRRAVEAHEFAVVYQPVVEIASGRVVGVEALVRWDHPDRGRVGPDEFIRLAEETDTIVEIGRWVMAESFHQAGRWPRLGRRRIWTSVNISARQLAQPDFVDEVLAMLTAADLPPSTISLEMTETAMLMDADGTVAKLAALRSHGIGISVDDFGTGYSSLSYLQRLPVSTLKIARDFIVQGSTPDGSWELANAIIALGQALRLDVVAEGVEEPAQLATLRSMGCRYVQGYCFARPLEAAAMETLLRTGGILQPGQGCGATEGA